MISGFREFEFDLPEALLGSLIKILDSIEASQLSMENVQQVPEAQGIYQLLLNGEVVYIGKTDAETGLNNRLKRHAFTIQNRRNLNPSHVRFKAVRIFVFTAMDLETQLIRHYAPVPWNNSGFGSNDPGRERDTTNMKPKGFDAQFPIDLDKIIALENLPAVLTGSSVIRALQRALPYTLRAQAAARNSRKLHPAFEESHVVLPAKPFTTRALLESVVAQLPTGWQATLLPGRVIIYHETRDYPYGEIIARS